MRTKYSSYFTYFRFKSTTIPRLNACRGEVSNRRTHFATEAFSLRCYWRHLLWATATKNYLAKALIDAETSNSFYYRAYQAVDQDPCGGQELHAS